MRRLFWLAAMTVLLSAPSWAGPQPGAGVTVRPARATWDTGYFQEALVRRGLEALGYRAEKPKELQNQLFYQSVALGDVDYWANGWFPMHREQMPKDFDAKAEIIGYVVKAGGLQGYLASKWAVEKYGITSLDDFKRPEVRDAFDTDGDGKAELVACPPGWGCDNTITYHLDTYGLEDVIHPLRVAYTAGMADALAKFNKGEPILFYTWAPNWTIFKLKPGRDVMWIEVPEIRPRPVEMEAAERMTVAGVEGAVRDPAKLGFVAADIRMVANKAFLAANPAARRFFEVFTLPLGDINEQNTRMYEGEKSRKDIRRHVDQWIAKNQARWDGWLAEARAAAASRLPPAARPWGTAARRCRG
jgi:glycine betaine/proline transport system substrate-binding protein